MHRARNATQQLLLTVETSPHGRRRFHSQDQAEFLQTAVGIQETVNLLRNDSYTSRRRHRPHMYTVCSVASIQVLHNERWLFVTAVRKPLEKGPDLAWMQALSPGGLQQYTGLHINLREDQPRKRYEPWVKSHTTSGLAAKSVLYILDLLCDLTLAET